MRKPFKSSVLKDQQIVTINTRPAAIQDTYLQCDAPPALDKLNPYRFADNLFVINPLCLTYHVIHNHVCIVVYGMNST